MLSTLPRRLSSPHTTSGRSKRGFIPCTPNTLVHTPYTRRKPSQHIPHASEPEQEASTSNVTPTQTPTPASSQKPPAIALSAAGIALVAGIFLLGPQLSDLTSSLEETLTSAGPFAGPAIFVSVYIASALLLLPGSVLTLAAGYIFGPLQGTALVSVASTAAATLAFIISRYLARPVVTEKLTDNDSFRKIDSGIQKKGARLVLLLRLSPLVPFSLSNYLYGLTSVPLVEYVLASWVGMLPGTFAYVYLASAARVAVDAAASGGGDSSDAGLIKTVLYGVGAVATLLATKVIGDLASSEVDGEEK